MGDLWRSTATHRGEKLALEHADTLPICPFAIADALDIVVEPLPRSTTSMSGTLVYVNNTFGIQYATYLDNPGFERFSVAHELGHYSIPEHPQKLLSTGQHISKAGFVSEQRCELEADHFAAGLLMPSPLFDAATNRLHSGLDAVERLAEQCETSLTATAIRYAQRTADPIAVVVSTQTTIDYAFLSDELLSIGPLQWPRKGSPLPRDSVTYRFNQASSNVLNAQRAENPSSLSAWFGSSHPYELYEETVGLGRYNKTLTVLSIDELPDAEEREEDEALMESWTPRFKR